MQKSIIQDINSLSYSTFVTNTNSFVRAYPEHQFSDLRNSRIQNLPGHKREDLSNKLNFVVVFQTIEIQRLNLQIESLRVRAKDHERQMLNFQNYEIQIRQLTQKCHYYEQQEENIKQEITYIKLASEKMFREFEEYRRKYGPDDQGLKEKYMFEVQRCQQLQTQVQKWKVRFNGQEIARSKEMEQIRQQFQNKRKSMINRQIKELTIKYQNELAWMSVQIRKERQQLANRESQCNRYRQENSRLILLQQEMNKIDEKVYEYENRLALLGQENHRLNQLVRWKGEENQKIKESEVILRRELEQFRSKQQDVQLWQQKISIKEEQIKKLTILLSREQAINQQLKLISQKMAQNNRVYSQLQVEIQKLNRLVAQKVNTISQLKTTIKVMQTKLVSKSSEENNQIRRYQQRISDQIRQKQRHQAQFRALLVEKQGLKQRCSQYQVQRGSFSLLQDENQGLKIQLSQFVSRVQEFTTKIALLQENLSIMQDIQSKLKNQEQIKRQLMAQREKLNMSIRTLTMKAQTAQAKSASLQLQINKYQDIREELTQSYSRISYMTQQIDRLRTQVQNKIGQLQQLKITIKNIQKTKNSYQMIESKLVENLAQMEKLILDLDNQKRSKQRVENEKLHLQTNFKKLQGDMVILSQEKDDLSRTVEQKKSQQKNYLSEIASLSERIGKLSDVKVHNQRLQLSLSQLTTKYGQMQSRFNKQYAQNRQYSMQIEKISAELIQVRKQNRIPAQFIQQFSQLVVVMRQKDGLIISLQKRIQIIQAMLRELRQNCSHNNNYARKVNEFALSINEKFDKCSTIVMNVFNSYVQQKYQMNVANLQQDLQVKIQGAIVQQDQDSIIALSQMETETNIHHEQTDKIIQGSQVKSALILRQAPQATSMVTSFIQELTPSPRSRQIEARTYSNSSGNIPIGLKTFGAMKTVVSTQKIQTQPVRNDFNSHSPYFKQNERIENESIQANRNFSKNTQNQGFQSLLDQAGIKRVTSYKQLSNNNSYQFIQPAQVVVQRMSPQPSVRILSPILNQRQEIHRETSSFGGYISAKIKYLQMQHK